MRQPNGVRRLHWDRAPFNRLRICSDDEGNRVPTHSARFRPRYRMRQENPHLALWNIKSPVLRDPLQWGDGRLEFMDLPHQYLRLTSLVGVASAQPRTRGTSEMGVADHVLESITGYLSRRMLDHESNIRIDAKRQALDALDVQCGHVLSATDSGDDPQNAEIEAISDVPESVGSQSRNSLTLSGPPPHGKHQSVSALLIFIQSAAAGDWTPYGGRRPATGQRPRRRGRARRELRRDLRRRRTCIHGRRDPARHRRRRAGRLAGSPLRALLQGLGPRGSGSQGILCAGEIQGAGAPDFGSAGSGHTAGNGARGGTVSSERTADHRERGDPWHRIDVRRRTDRRVREARRGRWPRRVVHGSDPSAAVRDEVIEC
jgi:hypothetical protein